ATARVSKALLLPRAAPWLQSRRLRPGSGDGGVPIQGASRVDVHGVDDVDSLGRGAVVVVEADGTSDPIGAADVLVAALRARALRAVSVSRLLDSAASTPPTDSDVVRSSAPAATNVSATARPALRAGEVGQDSLASSGASPTGTKVVNENTSGATCVTRR